MTKKSKGNFTERMDAMMEYLSKLTKEEADFIEHVLKWDKETQAAFIMAKRIFDDDDN